MNNQSYNWANSQTKEIEVKRLPLQASYIFPLELAALRALGVEQTRCLLDFGCGDGTWSSLLGESLGAKVVGVDKSHLLIEVAKEKNPGIEYHVVDDSEGLRPLLERSAPDTIIARFVCQHLALEDRNAFVSAVRETLPLSRIVLIDVDDRSLSLEPANEAIYTLLRAKGERQRALGGDREIGGKLVSILCDAGFVDVRMRKVRIHSSAMGFDRWKEIVLPVLFAGTGDAELPLVEEAKKWGAAAHRDAHFDIYVSIGTSSNL